MAQLERLRVFPVKGFDGIDVQSTEILDGGTLAHDREFALFDANGAVINGKRTDRIHELDTDFDPESREFTVETADGRRRQFVLDQERERVQQWFGDFFDVEVELRRDRSLGYVDRREMGPSVVSTATVRTVASWFDEMSIEGARRRLRANVEISGVPPFWEDRFVGTDAPAFEIAGVRFEGVTPCGRCVVPQRDPDTGDPIPKFRERFVRKRRETVPDWVDEGAFDHFYSLMIITRIPESDRCQPLAIGDTVEVCDRPEQSS